MFLPFILAWRLWAPKGSITDVLRDKGQESHIAPLTTAEHEAFLKPDALEESTLGTSYPRASGELEDTTLPVETTICRLANSVEYSLDVRETARLGLEFSILWVISST